MLEAKWACFFDLCEWSWQYEPCELDRYIPDFILTTPKRLLIEIKPGSTEAELELDEPKTMNSGWVGEYVIAGINPSVTLGVLPLPPNWQDLWAKACNTVQWRSPKSEPRPVGGTPPLPVAMKSPYAGKTWSCDIDELRNVGGEPPGIVVMPWPPKKEPRKIAN